MHGKLICGRSPVWYGRAFAPRRRTTCQIWACWRKYALFWGGKSTALSRVTTGAKVELVRGRDWWGRYKGSCDESFWQYRLTFWSELTHSDLMSPQGRRGYLVFFGNDQLFRSVRNHLQEARDDLGWAVRLGNRVHGRYHGWRRRRSLGLEYWNKTDQILGEYFASAFIERRSLLRLSVWPIDLPGLCFTSYWKGANFYSQRAVMPSGSLKLCIDFSARWSVTTAKRRRSK